MLSSNNLVKLSKGMDMARRLSTSTAVKATYEYKTLKVTNPHEYVFHVEMNRPEKRNAMNPTFFSELKKCFNQLRDDQDCRAVVLSGAGKAFSSGLDLSDLSSISGIEQEDVGRKAWALRRVIGSYQDSISSVEDCHKPVIACVHGYCVGGGVNLITACDIRYCSKDALFSVKEVDIGLAADIGAMQRMPKVCGNDSLVRELIYTARMFNSDEATQIGMVSKVTDDYESVIKAGLELAILIASKTPIAVQTSKKNVIYSRDHTVQEGLEYLKTWNAAMLQSEDVMKAAMASMTKEKAKFSKL